MRALIIANGTQPPLTIVRPTADAADLIVCADGGANHALRMNIKPDVIIGDFDSVLASTVHYYSHVPQVVDHDQDTTDLEKAIAYCIGRGANNIDIVGAIGNRLDHSTGTLGCFKKYGARVNLRVIDTVAEITLIKRSTTLPARTGEKLSLIPLDRCIGVTTTNLRYALSNEILELGVREGISNEATGSPITVTVQEGTLLLYRFHRQ